MDLFKCQTSTATPAEPGGLPRTLAAAITIPVMNAAPHESRTKVSPITVPLPYFSH